MAGVIPRALGITEARLSFRFEPGAHRFLMMITAGNRRMTGQRMSWGRELLLRAILPEAESGVMQMAAVASARRRKKRWTI